MRLYIRSHTVSHGLVRSLTVLYDQFQKSYTTFTDTIEWPECNSYKATVGSVVCTVLCQTGFRDPIGLDIQYH